ncbi:MAG: dCTP deaminase [Candidatus Dojkabacteria bacterium]|jgi:dCTP deaminase
MILSDITIKERLKSGAITIEPFSEEFLQPASYDLHLDRYFMVFNKENIGMIDVKEKPEDLMRKIDVGKDGSFIVHPGELVLANIKEIVGVDDKHVGRLEGKSSLGRIGLIVHATAGFLDPGNKLRLTLELANLSCLPIRIYEGMKISQIAFEELDRSCERPYGSKGLGSKYVGDSKVQESQMWRNFSK